MWGVQPEVSISPRLLCVRIQLFIDIIVKAQLFNGNNTTEWQSSRA